MANLKHPVVRPYVRDRLGTILHGVGKVLSVIFTNFAALDFFDCAVWKRVFRQLLDWFAGNFATVNEEPTSRTFEENPVIPSARDNHFDIVGHVDLDSKVCRGIVAICDQRVAVLVLHW
jgi:hypothetical protein